MFIDTVIVLVVTFVAISFFLFFYPGHVMKICWQASFFVFMLVVGLELCLGERFLMIVTTCEVGLKFCLVISLFFPRYWTLLEKIAGIGYFSKLWSVTSCVKWLKL